MLDMVTGFGKSLMFNVIFSTNNKQSIHKAKPFTDYFVIGAVHKRCPQSE